MGLDSVELVLEFEDEFGIGIPDSVAEQMLKIGDVVRYLAVRKGLSGNDEAGIQDIRRRVCLIVTEQMGITYPTLSDESRFVEDLGVT